MSPGERRTQQNEQILEMALRAPDGYYNVSFLLRAELLRRRLPVFYEDQIDRLYALKNEESISDLEFRVNNAALLLVGPFTQLLILQHQETDHAQSWNQLDPQVCEMLRERLHMLIKYFEDIPIYTEVFSTVLRVIDSTSREQNEQLREKLRRLAVQMHEEKLPVLLLCLDDYIGNKDYSHLEPDIKVLRTTDKYEEFIEGIEREVELLSNKSFDQKTRTIIAEAFAIGGWMFASETSGDNLLPGINLIIPEFYKYKQQVVSLFQRNGITCTESEFMRLLLRLYAAHEHSHGINGDEEFEADRVAIPATLLLARNEGVDEFKKQLLFIIADLACNMSAFAWKDSPEQNENHENDGYFISGILCFDALLRAKVIEKNQDNRWEIHIEHVDTAVDILLKRLPKTSIEEAMRVFQQNQTIYELFQMGIGQIE